MRTSLSRTARRVLVGLLATCVAALVVAVGAAPASSAAPPSGCPGATPAELAGFFDDEMPQLLTENRVPGAVVSVVSGGTTAFARGYGMADVERGVPMDASRSLVRIASISKLFTWTAVMQQVQLGRLDLDVDVNRYLRDFQVPATYPRPITLLDLMDHTAGFEDFFIGTGGGPDDHVPPLGEYLATHMPARIRPPGEVSAYSNYGAALAGHIVATVSGETYEEYVQRHLLEPLAMTHSTAAQPVSADLAADLARSYDSDATPPRPIPFMVDPMAPDGSLSVTATDVANFMNAQLHDGRYGDHQILAPATTARMHERSFAADPRLGGYAHGFMNRTFNGHRVLMHDGAWEGFGSVLMLVPGCDLGLFLSVNGTTGLDALSGFADGTDAFFDRFLPAPAVPDRASVSVRDTGTTVAPPRAGFYEPARHNESTVEKLVNLVGPARLTVGADGVVHFTGKDWVPQADGLYQAADGTNRLVFLAGPGGRRYVATDGPTYQLMARTQTLPVNLAVLLVFGLPALSAVALSLLWSVRRLTRRPATISTTWRLARGLAVGSAVLGVVFLVALAVTLFGNQDFVIGVPLSFRLLLGVPIVLLGTAVVAAVSTVRGWRDSGAGIIGRVHQVTLLAGLVALAWFLWQWNLIGWQFA